jgi:hypothetical protein
MDLGKFRMRAGMRAHHQFLILVAILSVACAPQPTPAPTPDANATETRIAFNIFATLTASAPTPTLTATPALTPTSASGITPFLSLTPETTITTSPQTRDDLIKFAIELGELIRKSFALFADFDRWYAKVQNRTATESEIKEYTDLLSRRLALYDQLLLLHSPSEAADYDQWVSAAEKWYEAELSYSKMLVETDPLTRRTMYDRFVSASEEGNRIYANAANDLIGLLERSGIDCTLVKMCVGDFNR